jgi:hypothetical protein
MREPASSTIVEPQILAHPCEGLDDAPESGIDLRSTSEADRTRALPRGPKEGLEPGGSPRLCGHDRKAVKRGRRRHLERSHRDGANRTMLPAGGGGDRSPALDLLIVEHGSVVPARSASGAFARTRAPGQRHLAVRLADYVFPTGPSDAGFGDHVRGTPDSGNAADDLWWRRVPTRPIAQNGPARTTVLREARPLRGRPRRIGRPIADLNDPTGRERWRAASIHLLTHDDLTGTALVVSGWAGRDRSPAAPAPPRAGGNTLDRRIGKGLGSRR